MTGALSALQVAFFRHNGYIRVPEAIGRGDADALLDEARYLLAEGPRDAAGYGRVSHLVEKSELFREMLTGRDEVLDIVESILGPNVDYLLNRHNHLTTAGGRGPAGGFHRDVLQWSTTVLTVVVALNDHGASPARTLVIPGSHQLPCVGNPNNGGTWLDENHPFGELIEQAASIQLDHGDVLLLDGIAFHRAGDASTERIVASAAYRAVDELDERPESRHRQLVRGARLYRGSV